MTAETQTFGNDEIYMPVLVVDRQVDILNEQVHESGLTIQEVWVDDESNYSSTKEFMQQAIEAVDSDLKAHPDWQAPTQSSEGLLVVNNPVSEWVYGGSATMAEWREKLVPSAKALEPMQRPYSTHLSSGGEVDSTARSFFLDALDSIGIRSRARIMASIVERYVQPEAPNQWVSLASGAAIPVIDTMKGLNPNVDVKFTLVDYDPDVLDYARSLVEKEGLASGDKVEYVKSNLLRSMISTDGLVDELGEESVDVVDALGIFEYFRDDASAKFLHNAYRLVKPGGVLIAANMLTTRPELDFNQRGIGWPKIFPRSVETLSDIIVQSGIPLDQVTVTIPQDGVYGVMEIRKQAK